MSTAWATGDAMSVFYSNAGEANYNVSKYTYVGSGNEFTGSASHLGETNDWLLFYPYYASNKNAAAVKYTVAAAQTQQGNSSTAHLCGENFPLYGKSLGLAKTEQMHIAVDNVNAALVFDVTNTEDYSIIVKEVVFTAPAEINGDFVADLTKDSFEPAANGNNSNTVTVTVTDGTAIANGASASFYAGVVPFTAASGSELNVTIKAVKADDPTQAVEYEHTYTLGSNTSFAAGVFKHFTVNFEDTSAPAPSVEGYSLVTSVPSDWSGRYIIVSADKSLVFTGDNSTSNSYTLQSSDLNNGIITKDCSSYEFTIQKSGDNYYLIHNNQYMYCSYRAGNGTTGIAFSSNQQALNFELQSNGTFGFWMNDGSTDQYLYYKSGSNANCFKFGGHSNGNCVYLYKYSDDNTVPDTPTTPTGDQYVKVTSAPTDWSGTYLFVDETSSKAFAAMDGITGHAVSVTINNGTIESNNEIDEYALTVTATGVNHTNVGQPSYSVQNSDGKYIFYSQSVIQIADTDVLDKGSQYGGNVTYNHCFAYQDGAVQVLSSGNYNGFTKYYLAYSNSAFSYSSTESHNIQLYKLETGTTPSKQDQLLSFSTSPVTWILGDTYKIGSSYDVQPVQDAMTTVTYSSSDPSVATVSGTKITIVGAGTTSITATAAASAAYNAASAYYELQITSTEHQGEDKYDKVTEEPSSWDGTYIVVDETAHKAFTPFAENKPNFAYDITIENGVVYADIDLSKYAITITDAGVDHANGNLTGQRAYDVKNTDGYYLYWSSDFGNLSEAEIHIKETNQASNNGTTYTYYHAFKVVSGGVQLVSAIHLRDGNAYYLGYSDGAFNYTTDSSRKVQLYKLSGSVTPQPGKQDQTLSFSTSPVTWTLGDTYKVGSSYNVQTVSGAQTSVSYSSSNSSVATVNGNKITIVGTGSTTITATAASSTTYNAASASYELRINPAAATIKGYSLVTSVPSDWSGRYIIVSADKSLVFTGNNGTSNSYALQPSDLDNGIITKDCSSYEFTIQKSGDNYYLIHNNQYMYCSYRAGNGTTGIAFSSNQQALNFELQSNGTFGFWMNDGSTDQYLYYKSGSNANYFKFGGSSEGNCVYLYKYSEESTTPDTPSTPEGNSYVKVTSAPTDWSGTYLIVDEGSNRAFAYDQTSGYNVSVTIDNGTIAATSELANYAVTVSGVGKKHANNTSLDAYDVKTSTGKYIFYSNSSINVSDNNYKVDSGTTYYYYHTFMYDNGVQMMSGRQQNGSNKYYMRYSSGFGYSTSSSNRVQLYKLSSGSSSGKQNQTLSFSTGNVAWTIGNGYAINGTYSVQSVNGAKTAVTYTSNNSSVATISGTQLTIKGTGTTTITATAQASDTYNAGSATYTLVITQEGAFNLENSSLKSYLDAAATSYTNDNYSSTSIVTNYSSNSASNRKDTPAPVTLSWTSSTSGTKTVYVYNNSSMTDLEMSTTTTSSSVDILNLIPNRQYWYKVMSSSNSQIASGNFTTEGRRRMLKVSDTYAIGHANNCRDFGGLTTTDGKTLKYGMIFRGTNMDATTDTEKEYLTGYMNVGLDVDLRSSSGWGGGYGDGDSGSSYSNNPYSDSKWGVTYCNAEFSGTISDFYVGTANSKFVQLFTAILSTLNSGKAAYIHCYVGADRTGYTCMLLEAVLGVSQKDCSIDFELTSFSVVGTRTRTGSGNTIGKDGLNYISGYSKGSTFQEKAYNILLDYGVTANQIAEFKSLMLQ